MCACVSLSFKLQVLWRTFEASISLNCVSQRSYLKTLKCWIYCCNSSLEREFYYLWNEHNMRCSLLGRSYATFRCGKKKLLTNLDVCFDKSSGNKAVTYLQKYISPLWLQSQKNKTFNSEDSSCDPHWFGMEWPRDQWWIVMNTFRFHLRDY